jgi:hypothetical protein
MPTAGKCPVAITPQGRDALVVSSGALIADCLKSFGVPRGYRARLPRARRSERCSTDGIVLAPECWRGRYMGWRLP